MKHAIDKLRVYTRKTVKTSLPECIDLCTRKYIYIMSICLFIDLYCVFVCFLLTYVFFQPKKEEKYMNTVPRLRIQLDLSK